MKYLGFVLIFLVSSTLFARNTEQQGNTQTEQEQNFLNYSELKKVLIEDNLDKELEKKETVVKKIQTKRIERNKEKYNYPSSDEFWTFVSEYWLIKNAQTLQWDFQKPEYGIQKAFTGLMENLGYYNKTFKLLIINSPVISHVGLPGNPNEYIFLISLPFMRTLDLTKVEISLLMLEDFFRLENDILKEKVGKTPAFVGQNFMDQKPDTQSIINLGKEYSEIIYKKGFSFEEQYKVTKLMDKALKPELGLWSSYIKMLNKIDRLIKSDLMYKNYNTIYPSPELQIKWLTPKKPVL